MDHLGIGRRSHLIRDPRHIAFEHQDGVGVLDETGGRIAEVHRMIGRQTERFRHVADDREGKARRQLGQCRNRRMVVTETGCDDQRALGAREDLRRFGKRVRVGHGRAQRFLWVAGGGVGSNGRGEHFTRQGEVDRPARIAGGKREGAVECRVDLLRHAHFVIPFHGLAHETRLIKHLLRPVDEEAARAELAGLRKRRPPGGHHQRNPLPVCIHHGAHRVGGANVDMQHDHLRPSRHEIMAIGHGDGEVLVWHGDSA